MTTTRNNGPARPSRATLDPDRVPSDPTGDGYWPFELSVCGRCSCLLPATEVARRKHREHHAQVDSHDPR
jgi:hypothetical protein